MNYLFSDRVLDFSKCLLTDVTFLNLLRGPPLNLPLLARQHPIPHVRRAVLVTGPRQQFLSGRTLDLRRQPFPLALPSPPLLTALQHLTLLQHTRLQRTSDTHWQQPHQSQNFFSHLHLIHALPTQPSPLVRKLQHENRLTSEIFILLFRGRVVVRTWHRVVFLVLVTVRLRIR